jgi:hypothetical protein
MEGILYSGGSGKNAPFWFFTFFKNVKNQKIDYNRISTFHLYQARYEGVYYETKKDFDQNEN